MAGAPRKTLSGGDPKIWQPTVGKYENYCRTTLPSWGGQFRQSRPSQQFVPGRSASRAGSAGFTYQQQQPASRGTSVPPLRSSAASIRASSVPVRQGSIASSVVTNATTVTGPFNPIHRHRKVGEQLARSERVRVPQSPARPVRIEERVKRIFERDVLDKSVQYVQPLVAEEVVRPSFQVVEKVVEIPGTPRIRNNIVEVPVYVDQTVDVPSRQPPIIHRIPKSIERIEPRTTQRVVEKVITTPRKREVKLPVTTEKPVNVPGKLIHSSQQVVISDRILPPVVKEAGVVEIPITRIVPQIRPIDIVVPAFSMRKEDLTAKIMEQVRYNVVRQEIRPLRHVEARLRQDGQPTKVDELMDEANAIQPKLRVSESPDAGFAVDLEPRMVARNFGCADYNSWLLTLNQHLTDAAKFDIKSEDPSCLMHLLPYIRDAAGNVAFLEQGSPMIGTVQD